MSLTGLSGRQAARFELTDAVLRIDLKLLLRREEQVRRYETVAWKDYLSALSEDHPGHAWHKDLMDQWLNATARLNIVRQLLSALQP